MNDAGAKFVGKPVPRLDALDKVTGRTRYMSDLKFDGMLWGRIKRSDYPHARIKGIDVSKARQLPGVVCVLTHEDVPGVNGFGIVVPDQPVLCWDKVRYIGDAVALVAAETLEIASEALDLIRVDYEPLPLVDDPVAAMEPGSALVHDGGNIHSKVVLEHGDVETGFSQADLIIENRYTSPRQEHAFLETESGIGMLDENGNIIIWGGSQYPHRDQMQIGRALGIDPRTVRVITGPVGGAFGGKDEITVQIHLALLAKATGRPVKIWLSREESIISGWKRHPEVMWFKTGFKSDGTIVANQVKVVADTGAYASLGGPVVNLSIEHSSGPYRVPNFRGEGYCVYTNNGVSGAFRGFGAPQVVFAMETQLDMAAEKLGIDRLEIRKLNALRRGDISSLGHKMTASVGVLRTLEAAERSPLWQKRHELKAAASAPWKKRGVGIAAELHGTGLGVGLPDFGSALIDIQPDGGFVVRVGCPEIGQGNMTAFAQIAAEELGCDISKIRVITGDTGEAPDSGTSTASRSVYTGGNAIVAAAREMKARLRAIAAQVLDRPEAELEFDDGGFRAPDGGMISYADIGDFIYRKGLDRRSEGSFVWPVADLEIPGVFGLPHLIYSYITQIALVEVDTLTGKVDVLEVLSAPDAGRVINRQGLEGQGDGGAVMGMGYALWEHVEIKDGKTLNPDFSTYIIPTALDSPKHTNEIVEVLEETGPYGAKGIGEAVMVPVIPAITNAIHDATGVWVKDIPATPERVYRLLKGAKPS